MPNRADQVLFGVLQPGTWGAVEAGLGVPGCAACAGTVQGRGGLC